MFAPVRILVGTSGFSYPAWKGSFYPEDITSPRMLAWYSQRLPAVEVNNTFYRTPKAQVLSTWRHEVPDGFRFALKAPQRITHLKRLADVEQPVAYFWKVAATLGAALGPVLFQLPPQMRRDVRRLRDFMTLLPEGAETAFEFRHASWFDDEVFAALAERGAALCANQTDDLDAPLLATGPVGYLRLRRPGYTASELDEWAARIRAQPWHTAYVFFKHEDEARGPKFALALAAALRAESSTESVAPAPA
ncbi:MAG TPA: DUF72 domain-containing protein [Anaeromyxobacteraceae bacterium]|nr:DUF72 domain-containing protein [Anaeromyxobacteraceae bacterium]